MKPKAIIVSISIVILLLAVSLSGCATPPASTTPAAVPYATTTYVDQKVVDLTTKISTKAETSAVASLQTRIDNLIGGGSGGSYTKAEVDTKIATLQSTITTDQARIKVLEDKLAGTSIGTGTGGTVTGSVTVITSPTNVQILGNGQVCYTAKVVNGINNWVYVRPIITINAAAGQSPTTVSAVSMSIGGNSVNLATANFQFTPVLIALPGTATSSITAIPISGGNGNGEFQIAANTTADLLICIQITSANPIIWNIGTSVNSRTL